MDDNELLEYARKFIDNKKIKGRGELQKKNISLYTVLLRRKLIDRAFAAMEEGRKAKREFKFFKQMSDEELVAYAKKCIKEKGISRKTELRKADAGLYDALSRRKLQDKVGLEERRRKWRLMSDEEVVSYTKEFLRERGIRRKKGLERADPGLYRILQIRKLLDRAFEDIEQARERDEAQALFDGLMEFGDAG